MWARGTRSDLVVGPAEDPRVDEVLATLERELRASGRLSFATCEELRRDPDLDGLEAVLAFLRCTVFATHPDTPPVARRRRVQASRLMLISLSAHTETPRWTVFQLEQLVEAAMAVPGAELSDLVQAQFALLAETRGPTTAAQASYLRELAEQVAVKQRAGRRADDFVWIAVRLHDPVLPVSEAQAYFATHALPRRLRNATREVLLRTLQASPFADEVARTLAD